MSFKEKYINAYKELGIDLTEEDSFLEEIIEANEKILGAKYPKALREYYLVAGNHDLNFYQDPLVDPTSDYQRKKIKSIKTRNPNDFLIIRSENQSCEHWGIKFKDFKENDPLIYGDIDSNYEYGPYVMDNKCSDYLAILPYVHAIYAFDYSEEVEISYLVMNMIQKKWKKVGSHDNIGSCYVSLGRIIWGAGRKAFFLRKRSFLKIQLVARNLEDFFSIDEEFKLNLMKDNKVGPGPKLRCKLCHDIIQSQHRYDKPRCKCGQLRVTITDSRCSINAKIEERNYWTSFNLTDKREIDENCSFEILYD